MWLRIPPTSIQIFGHILHLSKQFLIWQIYNKRWIRSGLYTNSLLHSINRWGKKAQVFNINISEICNNNSTGEIWDLLLWFTQAVMDFGKFESTHRLYWILSWPSLPKFRRILLLVDSSDCSVGRPANQNNFRFHKQWQTLLVKHRYEGGLGHSLMLLKPTWNSWRKELDPKPTHKRLMHPKLNTLSSYKYILCV